MIYSSERGSIVDAQIEYSIELSNILRKFFYPDLPKGEPFESYKLMFIEDGQLKEFSELSEAYIHKRRRESDPNYGVKINLPK